jgi:hypothetical protein
MSLRRAIGLLALLVLLATGAAAIPFTRFAWRVIDSLERIAAEWPTVRVRRGEASADVPQPWVRSLGRDQQGRELVVIIDTTGTTGDFGAKQSGLLLKRRELVARATGPSRALSLARFPDGELGPKRLRDWLARGRWLVPLAFAALAFVWFAFAKGTLATLLVLIALAASGRRRRPLRFGELFACGVKGLAPAVLLEAVLRFLPIGLWAWLPYFALAIVATAIVARRVPDVESV